ncbi:hypothetical protein V493_00752, partial [Pseudogymnoascus sp. VKM F-4281 (FW-2241)]
SYPSETEVAMTEPEVTCRHAESSSQLLSCITAMMDDSATQIEQHLASLRASLDEFECLQDPKLLWPDQVTYPLAMIHEANTITKGQPWPPSVERYVHRYMHESNLYQVYRSTEVKFEELVRLLATHALPSRDIHDSLARRCKQLINQSSKRWHTAGWLGLRRKTYYKKDHFQQCWDTHAGTLVATSIVDTSPPATSIAVTDYPQKKVMRVQDLLDGDGQAKRGSDEPLQQADVPAKRNRMTGLEADSSPQALTRAGIDSLQFRSTLNRPTMLAPIPELVEETIPDRSNTNKTIPIGESASQTSKQALFKETNTPMPSLEIGPPASPRQIKNRTYAWIYWQDARERRVDDQSCRSHAPSPTLSSGPGTSEMVTTEHNDHQSALASLPRIDSSLTAAPANNTSLTAAPARFTAALASLRRIDTSITTPPIPASPLQPVNRRLTTAPARLPQPVNNGRLTVPETFDVKNYLAPALIRSLGDTAKLLVQKLGEALAYSLLDTLMSLDLSTFFSWYSRIMRVDSVHALVFKLLETQSPDIVVIRSTPDAFQHLKHYICKVYRARASTRHYSDAFRVVVLPYPILTAPQIPIQVSSSVEVLVRIQVTPEGNFSVPYHLHSISAMRTVEDFFLWFSSNPEGNFSEPYHFKMISAMRTVEDFFSWFSSEARYKRFSGLQTLSFCFKDAAPSLIIKCIERGNAQQFEDMKGDIQRICYDTLAYMPRMKDFTILVAVPGWIIPGWSVPRWMVPE